MRDCTKRVFSRRETVYERGEASQQQAARVLATGARCLLPAAQRTHAGTHERSFPHRHIGLCCAARCSWPYCSRASAVFRCRARARLGASITSITTCNRFCRTTLTPLYKPLHCYLRASLPGRFAELLSALVCGNHHYVLAERSN